MKLIERDFSGWFLMNLGWKLARTFIFPNVGNVYGPLEFAKYFSYIYFHLILPTSSGIMSCSYPHLTAEEQYITQGPNRKQMANFNDSNLNSVYLQGVIKEWGDVESGTWGQ